MMRDPAIPETRQVTGDGRGRRTAGLVLVLLVTVLGIAVAKPWGSASPAPPQAPLVTAGTSDSPSPTATAASEQPSTSPTPAGPPTAGPATDVFGIPVPPAESATWTAIQWRRLAPDDPLRLVQSVLRWRGGYIAVGSVDSGGSNSTPVWTSRDGGLWMSVPFDTATTFWPGLLVVGVAEVPSGLVALTLLDGSYQCGAACPTYSPALPLMAWTSPDGRSWTPRTGPDIGSPAQWAGPPRLAAGPAGLAVASPTAPTRMATSADGIHWRTTPARALPAGLVIRDIAGTAAGLTAVGSLPVDASHETAVAEQSVDGITWTGPFALDLASASGIIRASTGASWRADALVSAQDGLIAMGRVTATPGATLWWQTANGRDWRPLPAYGPLGPTACTGEGCGLQPNGVLVGDGGRMIALRGGSAAGAWASSDGLAWHRLPVSGELPADEATQAVLVPGGVLLSDGTTTWFGEPQGR